MLGCHVVTSYFVTAKHRAHSRRWFFAHRPIGREPAGHKRQVSTTKSERLERSSQSIKRSSKHSISPNWSSQCSIRESISCIASPCRLLAPHILLPFAPRENNLLFEHCTVSW